MVPSALRRRLLLSSTMLVAAVAGYGRRAYGACVFTSGSSYVCSGANVTTQTITANNASVSTVAGFSVDTTGTGGNAITITGDGALSYTDTNASPLTAPATGTATALYVKSTGNDVGTGTPGSVTIDTNGVSSGVNGIQARNSGSGAITITANGNVTGTYSRGIYANNSAAGTDLRVTTGAGTTVSGFIGSAIDARNHGTGALTITVNGNLTSAGTDGIFAHNYAASTGDLTVTTAAGTTVSGLSRGIAARNFGHGALTITANGNVTSAGKGIYARNSAAGTGLSITTGTGTTVSGVSFGILAQNYAGALTITANGNVTSTYGVGIWASNYAASTGDLTVTTGGTVSGSTDGIYVRNSGHAAVTIKAYGNVTGTNGRGIYARNSAAGTDLSVTTAAGTTVSGRTFGIIAGNYGTGALTITANGNVSGTGAGSDGIRARNGGTDLTVTTAAGTTISGGTYGIAARNFGSGVLTITANGNVTGAGSNGIYALNNGTNLSITTDTSTTVSGGSFGIQARNYGTGALTITANGNVTGTHDGIYAVSTGGAIGITVAATSTVTSTGTAANAFAIETVTGPATVTVAGTVAGSMQLGGAGSTLTFLPGAVYKVFVNGATASLATVNGTATLAGTVNASFQAGSLINTTYTILTATGGFGATRFAGVSSPNFTTSLSYNPGDTDVFLTLNAATLGAGTPLSPGQQSLANVINSYFNNGGALSPGFATVFGLTGGALTNALTQVSGQPGATAALSGIGAAGQFMSGLFGTAFGGGGGFSPGGGASGYAAEPKLPREAAEAYAAVTPREAGLIFDRRWNVWATGFGGSTTVDGNAAAGSNTTTSSVHGAMAGADYGLSPNTRVGFALGGAGSSFNVDGGFGGGKADIFNAALYAKHIMGPAYLAGALAYGWQGTTTDRTVTVAGTDRLHASFDANSLTGRAEGGWTFAMPVVSMTPYAAVQSTAFFVPSYGETATSGSNQFALTYAAQTVVSTRSELGLHWDKTVAVTGGRFTWLATTAWAHDFNADNTATASASFQSLPGSAAFTTNGAAPASDLALVSAGAQMAWTNGWSVSGTFLSELASTSHSYGGKGTLRYAFN